MCLDCKQAFKKKKLLTLDLLNCLYLQNPANTEILNQVMFTQLLPRRMNSLGVKPEID